ncbi:hypothetical protein QQ045_003277 [Rhodiola kirilowii]
MATYFSPYDSIPSETEFGDFSGQDVDGWLCQIENFFNRYLMAPEQRLAVIHNYLAGEATYWHYEMYMSWRLTTWESFVTDLRHRFKPTKTLINQQEVIEEPDDGAIDLSIIVAEEREGDKETEIVVVADTEVTSGIYSVDFSSMLVLNDAEISQECFETKLCAVNNTLSSCLQPVCENASMIVPSIFMKNIARFGNWYGVKTFQGAALSLNPPKKPPDNFLNALQVLKQLGVTDISSMILILVCKFAEVRWRHTSKHVIVKVPVYFGDHLTPDDLSIGAIAMVLIKTGEIRGAYPSFSVKNIMDIVPTYLNDLLRQNTQDVGVIT